MRERQPITDKLLVELSADHPDERLEVLTHPTEPQYAIVVRTPHLAEFKKWKRNSQSDREAATEKLVLLCLVYPPREEWDGKDGMLDERPALSDTFGADIPKLIGATEDDCVCDDPAVLAPLEEQHGAGNLRHLRHPRYGCDVVLKRPRRDAYKRFKAKATSKQSGDAPETLLVDCIVSPSLDEWKALADRMPGLVETYGSAAVTFAGGSPEFTGKK